MAEENFQPDNEDLQVSGTHKSHKKKKGNPIYTLVIVILLGVMVFSGYQIGSTLIRNAKARSVYDDIISDVIAVLPDTQEETLPPETTEAPSTRAPESTELPTQDTEAAETHAPSESETEEETEEESTEETTETEEPEETEAPTRTAAGTQPAQSGGSLANLGVDFTRLKSINSDVIAWLQGQDNQLSYPVVQGKDNEYYLKHLIDGSYNGNGTLFVHCANHFLRDDVSYIFGHHMYGGAMFGNLKKYDSSAYYWNHPEFKLYTPSKTYTLRIYAVFYGTGVEKITFNYSSEASFNAAMKAYAARALHTPQTSVSYGDKLVCLCTCAYQVNNGRYFVLCKVMNP